MAGEMNEPAGGVGLLDRPEEILDAISDAGWTVLLYDDPVNPHVMVIATLALVLPCSVEKAAQLTAKAEDETRAAVYTGGKAEAERIASALTAARLTVEVVSEKEAS